MREEEGYAKKKKKDPKIEVRSAELERMWPYRGDSTPFYSVKAQLCLCPAGEVRKTFLQKIIQANIEYLIIPTQRIAQLSSNRHVFLPVRNIGKIHEEKSF